MRKTDPSVTKVEAAHSPKGSQGQRCRVSGRTLSEHRYHIQETFTAVEATHPPAEVHDRDAMQVPRTMPAMFVWFDETTALTPLAGPQSSGEAEAFPFGT